MRVLVADDDPVSRHLLYVSLNNSEYQAEVAGDGDEALRILEQVDHPRLLILDWMMPRMDGVEVCRRIRKRASEPYVYIVLLTAKGERKEMLEGLEAGADDYIIKPFDLHELKARLRTGKRVLDLQDQLIVAREHQRDRADRDSLTGLLNHSAILEVLQKEMVRSFREKTALALIMADLDHFKHINDKHGHQAGDSVLQEAARRLSTSVRVYDSVGRYGGEEFLIVAPGCGATEAAELAERLRQGICCKAIDGPGCTVNVTISLGVTATQDGKHNPEEHLRAADQALYKAKNEGRNRVQVSS